MDERRDERHESALDQIAEVGEQMFRERLDGVVAQIEGVMRQLRKMTSAEAELGRNFMTPDAALAVNTVTVSMREASTLLRALGPVGMQNGDGSYVRLFAAMHVLHRQLIRSAPSGRSIATIAALQVMAVAVRDHLSYVGPIEAMLSRSVPPAPRKRGRPVQSYPLRVVRDEG